MSKSVAIAGGTSDARNGKIFNIFSLVRIGERSGMRLSSLYGVWEKEKFAAPSIVESYEPDRTKVMVEFEADESELEVKVAGSGGEKGITGGKNLGSISAPATMEKANSTTRRAGCEGSTHVRRG